MFFKEWLLNNKFDNVVCHIAGPSGSGKTTLLDKIKKQFPNMLTKDLDDFDDDARKILNYPQDKSHYTDKMLEKLTDKKQKLLDKFIKDNEQNNIVFGGLNIEDNNYILDVHTNNKFLLNTSADTSYKRLCKRNRQCSDKDLELAKQDIRWFKSHGYKPMLDKDIIDYIKNR